MHVGRYAAACAFVGLVCLWLIFITGCASADLPVPQVVVTPTGPATTEELAAKSAQILSLKEAKNQLADLSQRAAGAVYGVSNANASNPDGLPKQAVAAQAQEAASALPEPTAEQKLTKERQNAAILAGQLVQVKAAMGQAITENEALKAKVSDSTKALAAADARTKQAEAAADAERRDAAAKLQAKFDAMTAKIKQAQDDARNQTMLGQVSALNKAGAWLTGSGLAALGLCAIFGGIAGLRIVGPVAALAAGMGMACFGLAQIVGQWWFKWAVLAAVVLLFMGAAWWVVAKYKQGTLRADAEAKAAKLNDALGKVVPVLDQAYNDASQTVKDVMDATIFKPLNNIMDGKDKATIHEVRAEQETISSSSQ